MTRFIVYIVIAAVFIFFSDAPLAVILERMKFLAGICLVIGTVAYVAGWGWYAAKWDTIKRAKREVTKSRREEAR